MEARWLVRAIGRCRFGSPCVNPKVSRPPPRHRLSVSSITVSPSHHRPLIHHAARRRRRTLAHSHTRTLAHSHTGTRVLRTVAHSCLETRLRWPRVLASRSVSDPLLFVRLVVWIVSPVACFTAFAYSPLGLGGASRLTGVLVLQRAEFLDLVCTLCTTLLRSRQLYLDSPIWSKLST